MAELITIPISTFDIVIDYERPSIRLWADRSRAIDVLEALFEAFRPWGANLDDIEGLEQGRNSEKGVRYRLPTKKASFFFSGAFCRFTQDDANWAMAQESLAILNAGVSTLMHVAELRKGKQRTSLALHLQSKTGKFIDILRPLIPLQVRTLETSPVFTVASVVKWGNRSVYIDGSGLIANAAFLKIDRDFTPDQTFEQIAQQIYADEAAMFNILGVEEDLS
jgi:hypothetical protein